MTTFAQRLTEDRRLLILEALAAAAKYTAPKTLLVSFLDSVGRKVSADVVATDLAWLAEQDLVEAREIEGDETIAVLTQRGLDVAEGRVKTPGVRRPAPARS